MSTTYTTNYHLGKQTDTSDNFDMSVITDNMDTIDTVLKDHSDKIDAAALGIKFKGEVNYYADLPNNAEIGDAYTVKYAGSSGTTPDGTEYVWGAVSGTNQWINFSKDSYTKAEVDALLALKVDTAGTGLSKSGTTLNHSNSTTAKTTQGFAQIAYDAQGHITGSTAATTAQANAINSGIDSEKVAQIETNKNNILWNTQNGVKNIAKPNTISATSGITIVQNLGHYEISGTTGDSQYTVYLCTPTEDIIATEELYIPAATTRTNVNYMCHWKNTRDESQYSVIGTGLTIPQGCKIHAIYIQVAANTTFSLNADMMICKKVIYDADPNYQPYALSNAELTERTTIYTVESSLFSYVNTLSEGIHFAMQKATTGTDKPVSDKRYMYQIFVYNSYFATIIAYECQSTNAPIMYIVNKENGTWGSWFKFEGIAVT